MRKLFIVFMVAILALTFSSCGVVKEPAMGSSDDIIITGLQQEDENHVIVCFINGGEKPIESISMYFDIYSGSEMIEENEPVHYYNSETPIQPGEEFGIRKEIPSDCTKIAVPMVVYGYSLSEMYYLFKTESWES